MEVNIIFNKELINLTYNIQTGYYEAEIDAPNKGGVYDVEITAKNEEEELKDSFKIQILEQQKNSVKASENLVYFLDSSTLDIKDILEYDNYEYTIDEETNTKTIFDVARKVEAKNEDIVIFKKDNEIYYFGIIENINTETNAKKRQATLKYITNIFDKDIILEQQDLIKTKGIEDFILYMIKKNFTESDDNLLNIKWLDVEITTHTKLNISVSTIMTNMTDDIFNFHTFITNCSQKYNIILDFKYENSRIKLKIYKQGKEKQLIDTTLDDISYYEEVFETNVIAKVTVKTDTSIKRWFLLNDRTTTTNINDTNRAKGKEVTLYTQNDDETEQTALDTFKANTYNHYVKFRLYKASQIFEVKNLKIGTPIAVRTKEGVILDTYISAITENGGNFVEYTCGNMRVNFIDKIKQKEK